MRTRRKTIDEDAVMAVGDASNVAGDVSSPCEPVDNSIFSHGISRDDILGKYEPGKGVFGKGDFNVPTNALGKGKVLKRYELPSLKKRGHKNPYIKGLRIISESEAHKLVEHLSHNISETESDVNTVMNKLRNKISTPDKLSKFISKHKNKFNNYSYSIKRRGASDSGNIFSTAWNSLKYAIAKGLKFIADHWWKILLLLCIIVLFVFFNNRVAGTELGYKLFGNGGGKVVNSINKVGKRLASLIIPTISALSGSNSVEIIPIDLVDDSVKVFDEKNQVWVATVKGDKRTCIASGTIADGVTSDWHALTQNVLKRMNQ